MSIGNLRDANALFLPMWNKVVREVKKPPPTEQEQVMHAFRKALRSCDKATENMMDKHHETVAKSAKKIAEYRKKKAQQDRIHEAALERELINESIMIQRINHRNMLEEIRVDELNRDEMQKARQ